MFFIKIPIQFFVSVIFTICLLQLTSCHVVKRQAPQWGNPFFGAYPNWGIGGSRAPTCPGGYFCSNADSKTICPEGNYCPPGSQARTACPTGMHSRQGATICQVCPPGYSCPQTGTGANIVGAVNPTKCAAGTYCPPGTGTGIACPQGYYCNNENAPNYEPIPCPAGSYTTAASRTSASECVTCPAGTSSQPGASACRATSGTGTGINAGNGFNNGFRPGLGGFNGYPGLGGFNGYGGYGGFNGFNPFFG